MEQLKQPGASVVTKHVTVPEDQAEPDDANLILNPRPSARRPAPESAEVMLARWLSDHETERVVLESGPSRVVLQSPFVWDNDTTIALAFDPKIIAFSLPRPGEPESMVTMELAFEAHVKLRYREGDIKALFAGGLFLFPGLPFGIVSFFKTKPEETS
jgi:hypothetical protein